MTCRHASGDPNCYSTQARYAAEAAAATPDSEKFEIEDARRVGEHLVLKVRYPNCSKCSYEGMKVMVFLNVAETQALRWKKIDPHFRKLPNGAVQKATEATSPAARFPASTEGWADALAYAESKRIAL